MEEPATKAYVDSMAGTRDIEAIAAAFTAGYQSGQKETVPADLARELYEAARPFCDENSALWDADDWKELRTALARYEREVGDG